MGRNVNPFTTARNPKDPLLDWNVNPFTTARNPKDPLMDWNIPYVYTYAVNGIFFK